MRNTFLFPTNKEANPIVICWPSQIRRDTHALPALHREGVISGSPQRRLTPPCHSLPVFRLGTLDAFSNWLLQLSIALGMMNGLFGIQVQSGATGIPHGPASLGEACGASSD